MTMKMVIMMIAYMVISKVLSVVLYTLIAVMLLFTAPRTFNDGTVRNQARLQGSDNKVMCDVFRCSEEMLHFIENYY